MTRLENEISLNDCLEADGSFHRVKYGFVREIETDNYLQRTCVNFVPRGASVARLDKHTYINLRTGEVNFYKSEAKGALENPRRIRKRCDEFRWRIRANSKECRLFVTLTYAENMTDTKRLYEDFRRFWQKLKRKYKQITGYLVAFEPQQRGAWHAHLLLLSEDVLFIPSEDLAQIWGNGFVKVEDCRNIDDVGDYLTSYLTDLDGKKGGRLSLYPSFFRFLRWSRGVKAPVVKEYPKETAELSEEKKITEEWVIKNDYEWQIETQEGFLAGRTILYINKNLHKKNLQRAFEKSIINLVEYENSLHNPHNRR